MYDDHNITIEEINPQANLAEVVQIGEIPKEKMDEFIELIKMVAAAIVTGGKIPPGLEFEDLVGFGYEGLNKAWKTYDHQKGAGFKTYASYRIRGEMLDMMRKEWRYRNPNQFAKRDKIVKEIMPDIIADSFMEIEIIDQDRENEEGLAEKRVSQVLKNTAISYMLSLDNIEQVSTINNSQDVSEKIHEKIEQDNEYYFLAQEIADLEEIEQKFVNLFYKESKTQKEISMIMDISKSKASRIHLKVLEKLRKRIKKRMSQDGDIL